MKQTLITFGCALALFSALTGCKKSEPASTDGTTEPSAAPSRSASETPPPASATEAKPASAPATGAVELQAKWPVGARYVYRLDTDQQMTNHIPMMPNPMEQHITMGMTYALSVLKETPEKGREIELEFLANEMEMKMGGQTVMSFDSKEPAAGEQGNPFVTPMRKMIGSKVHILLSADGTLDKIPNLQEWQKTLTGDAGGPFGGMVNQQFNESFFHQLLGAAKSLPPKPVQIGDTWPMEIETPTGPMGKIKAESTVKFQGWEERQGRRCAVLTMNGTFAGVGSIEAGPMGKVSVKEGKSSGSAWFDPELGAFVDNLSNQTVRMEGDQPPAGNPAGAAFRMEMVMKSTLTLVEAGKVK
jgi:hypothetical protein